MTLKFFLPLFLSILLFSCKEPQQLPVYGGKMPASGGPDTVDYHIPSFSFLNQDSGLVNEAVIKDKLLVVEFFFTHCPSICPKMQKEMLRVYEKYKSDPDVLILAYSIDPARDTVARLRSYAQKLGIESSKWHLLTGDKDSIYELADKFLISAGEDPDAPGGHVHSGSFILVDKKKRIRGYYDGTDEKSVEKLLSEIDILKQEPADAILKKPEY
jgi:protein SCO1